MRLVHVIRSFTMAAALSVVVLIAATSAIAVSIASPTEGRIVRDKVRIVIPRSSLPADASQTRFITIKVDGRFLAAIDTSAAALGTKTPVSPNIVYVWDTKSTINDPLLPEDQRHYKDGRHEITVEAHGLGASQKDIVSDTAKVGINLQNLIARPNPAPPIKLRYRYHLGQQSIYRIYVTAEILDPNGYSLTGGQIPVKAQFDVLQSIEDVQGDGSALIRYKVDRKSAFTQIFGQPTILATAGLTFNSVYKLINNAGKTIDGNVLSGRSRNEVTDCLIRLPNQAVQMGDMWQTSMKMKLEGLANTASFNGTSVIDDLEWDNGYECAKITTKLAGAPQFSFLPQLANANANAVNTAYFAYKAGKQVRDTTVIEYNTSIDTNTLQNIQQQMFPAGSMPSGGTVPGGMPVGGMPSAGISSGMGAMPPPMKGPGSFNNSYPGVGSTSSRPPSMPGGVTNTLGVMSVRVRFTVTKELR